MNKHLPTVTQGLLYFVSIITLLISGTDLYAQPAGWLYADQYRVNNNSTALREYQVRVVFDHAALVNEGHAREDGADLRFGASCAGGELLPYFIESGLNTATCLVWVRFPELPPGETPFLLFYGNPNATSESDPDAVFNFYDDFEAADIDPNKWERTAGSRIENGRLIPVKENFDRGGSNYIYSAADISELANVGIVECEVSFELGEIGGNIIFYSNDPFLPDHNLVQHDERALDPEDWAYREGGTTSIFQGGPGFAWDADEPVFYSITVFNRDVLHVRQSTLDASRRTEKLTGTQLPTFPGWNHIGFSAFQTVDGGMSVEFVRIRRYANPEPTVAKAAGGAPLSVVAGVDQSVCPGGSAALNAQISGGAPDYEFSWSPTDGLDNPNSLTPTATPAATTIYTLNVKDATDCEQAATVTITVNENPSVDLGEDVSICAGESITIGAIAGGGSGGYTYAWLPEDDLDDPSSPTPVASPEETRVYTLTVTDSEGCSTQENISVNVRPATDVAADRTALDFGILDACRTSGDVELQLTNNGAADITLETVVPVAGIDLPGTTLPLTIPAGSPAILSIRWTALQAATLNATLRLEFGPCDGAIELPLSGVKLESLLDVSAAELDFGAAARCTDVPRERSLTLRNASAAGLTVSELLPDADWQILEPATVPIELAPGAEQLVRVQLIDGPAADLTGTMTVRFASPDCSDEVEVRLRGTRQEVQAELETSEITLDPLTNCETEFDTSFILRNTGEAEISIADLSADVNGVILGSEPPRIAPGEEATIRVRYRPAQSGDVTAVYVVTLDPCGQELEFRINGRLESSTVSVPDVIDFGELLICPADGSVQATQNGQLVVQGNADVAINLLTGLSAPFTTDLATGQTANSATPLDFEISIIANQAGSVEQTLTLGLDLCDIERTITVRAEVKDVLLSGPAQLDFGTVQDLTPLTQSVSYSNEGDVAINIGALPNLPAPFSLIGSVPVVPANLAPGEEITLQIAYTPEAGVHDETVELTAEPCTQRLSLQLLAESPLEPRVTLRVNGPLSADHGQTLRALVVLDNAENMEQLIDPRVSLKLRFNKNLLRAADGRQLELDPADDSKHLLEYQASYDAATGTLVAPQADGVLMQAMLGDAVCTDIEIVDLAWIDSRVQSETVPTEFCLTGLCEAGGTRLVTSSGRLGIQVREGPLIEYEIIESGTNRILLADMLGRTTVLAEGTFVAGRYSLSLVNAALPGGRYFIILQTPTSFITESIEVQK